MGLFLQGPFSGLPVMSILFSNDVCTKPGIAVPPTCPRGGPMVPLGGLIVPARSHLPPISVRFAREPHAFGANFVGLVDGWRLFQAQGQGRDRHAKI